MTNITTENCAALLDILREKNPLVHCITNYVTANTVANGLLAAGASPVMADSPLDAEDITAKASAVLFNMGTLSKDRLRAMLISAQKAADMAKPIVLDPVGAGSTDNRLRSTMQLLRQFRFAAVRGNASEISALLSTSPITMKAEKGVDSAETTLEDKISLAKKAAKRYSCTGQYRCHSKRRQGSACFKRCAYDEQDYRHGLSCFRTCSGAVRLYRGQL